MDNNRSYILYMFAMGLFIPLTAIFVSYISILLFIHKVIITSDETSFDKNRKLYICLLNYAQLRAYNESCISCRFEVKKKHTRCFVAHK